MIYITDWRCPFGHRSGGILWDAKTTTREEVVASVEAVLDENHVGRVCGICQSRDIHPKHRATRFRTMEEADTALTPSEGNQHGR